MLQQPKTIKLIWHFDLQSFMFFPFIFPFFIPFSMRSRRRYETVYYYQPFPAGTSVPPAPQPMYVLQSPSMYVPGVMPYCAPSKKDFVIKSGFTMIWGYKVFCNGWYVYPVVYPTGQYPPGQVQMWPAQPQVAQTQTRPPVYRINEDDIKQVCFFKDSLCIKTRCRIFENRPKSLRKVREFVKYHGRNSFLSIYIFRSGQDKHRKVWEIIFLFIIKGCRNVPNHGPGCYQNCFGE